MSICQNCIVPDTFPNVEMTDGVCSFCQINEEKFGNKIRINKDKELLSLLTKKNQNEYDCVVPISGGKDSTYILYYLVKKLRLNPLAVYFDNGFATEEAVANVQNICKILDVELVVRHASIYRRKLVEEAWYISYYLQRIFPFCGNCENNIRSASINEALNHKIKYIIWGSTDYEDDSNSLIKNTKERFRDSFAGKNSFVKQFIPSLKLIAKILIKEKITFKAKIKACMHYLKYLHYFVMDNIKQKAPEGIRKFSPYLQVSFENRKIRTLYFYDYVPYDPFYQIIVLEREVGWKAPSGREAKMDCKLHNIGNLSSLKYKDITDSGLKLAVLARNGMISRGEAIQKEEKEVEFLKSYFQSENLEIRPALKVIKEKILKQNGIS